MLSALIRHRHQPELTGRSLGFVLTGGEVDLPLDKPRMMPAEKGSGGGDLRSALLIKGILPDNMEAGRAAIPITHH